MDAYNIDIDLTSFSDDDLHPEARGYTRKPKTLFGNKVKGFVFGNLTFCKNGDNISCHDESKLILLVYDSVTDISSDALFILLADNFEVFKLLTSERLFFSCNYIIVTQMRSHRATRLFLEKIQRKLKLPICAFLDCNPRGLRIMSYYGRGSKNHRLSDIKWIGLRFSDLENYPVLKPCRVPMTNHNIKSCEGMLKGKLVNQNPDWLEQLNLMMKKKEKMEFGKLSQHQLFLICLTYLPKKLIRNQIKFSNG